MRFYEDLRNVFIAALLAGLLGGLTAIVTNSLLLGVLVLAFLYSLPLILMGVKKCVRRYQNVHSR